MKIFGLILIGLACVITGFMLSRQCIARKKNLQLLERMATEIETLIRFRALTTGEILTKLHESPTYEKINFINTAYTNYTVSRPFSEIWSEAVKADSTIREEEKNLLCQLGNSLGTSDTESQISLLKEFKDSLSHIIKQAVEDSPKEAKLFRSLGVFAGTVIVILFC